jgi:hypothetical protein
VELIRQAKRGLAALVAALFVVTFFQAIPAQAATGPSRYVEGSDPAAFLYDPLNVNRIDLTLGQDSLRALAGDTFATHNGSVQVGWQPGTAVFTSYKGTLPEMQIATHLKGGYGSRRPIATCGAVTCTVAANSKPGIKIKFDYGAANVDQRFYGLKEITLNSMVQDQSMIHETTDYRIARSMGLPAPRTGYMRLFVNGHDLGLHMLIETYDKQFYKRWFTTGTNHAYEGAYWQDLILNAGGNVNNYASLQTKVGDPLNRDDLRNIASINELTGSDWWVAINKFADVGELTKDWAFEHFIEHWDAYSWFIINNYQVHFDGAGIMTMHPWGLDNTLQEVGGGDQNVTYLDTTTSTGRSVGIEYTRCLQVSACRLLYQAAILQVGTVADSIDSVGFIDQVWAAVGPTIMADPIAGGIQTQWAKDNARAFLATRTKTAEYAAAVTLRRPAEVGLTYSPPTNFVAGTVLDPLLMNNTGKAPRFTLMGDPAAATCSVDPYSGRVTALAPGDCVISVATAADANTSSGYHAGYAIAFIDLGKIPGLVGFPNITNIGAAQTIDLAITSNSTGAKTITTNSNCSYQNGKLTATATSGVCTVTVVVAKDSTHYTVTDTLRLNISREVISNYVLTTDADFVAGTKLPKGQTLPLIHKTSKVVGACVVTGTTLKALAATGKCTVTIGAWETPSRSYLAKTFDVQLAPSPQTWVQKVAAAVSKKKIGLTKFTLANASDITTTSGQDGFFSFLGNCNITQTPTLTAVQMTGPGLCTVTLEADSGYKVAGIKRVWTFTK